MAIDRILYWDKDIPSFGEMAMLLQDYLGDDCRIETNMPRIFGIIPLKPSWAFKRLRPDVPPLGRTDENERWIEIFMDDEHIDIMTRQQDDFTNAIAGSFHDLVRGYYRATKEKDPYGRQENNE